MKRPTPRTVGVVGSAVALSATLLLVPPSVAGVLSPVAGSDARAAAAATVTVAAAGDIAHAGSANVHQKQTANLITSVIHPDQVFMLGDGQYEHGELAQYKRSYDPTWGAFKNITAPVPGNHEYETSGASGYFTYFASQLSGRGSTASDSHAGYYSFNVGNWHIVALNSNCHFANCNAQANWLRNDVASDGHLCEIAMYHNPGVGAFESAAAAAKVDVVLAGHRHRYERWDHKHGPNLRLFVVGTGGKSAGTPSPKADGRFKGYGVLRLDLGASNYSWKFIDVGGQVRDSGSSSCHD